VFLILHHLLYIQDIRTMREQISRVKATDKIPMLLVGNKCDLASQREVHASEGAALAQLWGCPFLEASAKDRQKVDEVFIEIVREMNSQPTNKPAGCCTLV
jgi:Ras-related protein Rap-2C